ncbi:MAG TPA: DUF6531 domain-containing protein [Actinophytocola sp.]|uniref:DUF6531 domain-containing protein n=1 Tax=Actinophytocola sp. TaxID=1872138 RepID=UPI002DDD6D02|nr:DUF6531 domain-containing protein [Actinophytocola sp.]HEV2782191.1 DUF6531 domain-containing protein [Actinophytocola sp.]
MPDANPLVAAPRETTTAVTGIGIAESCVDLAHGVSNGDWVEAGLGVLGAGLEVLSMVIDPLGTLASYGVSWLIEHVRPLKEALDWFAGDPPVIRSFSETWGNVAAEVNGVAQEFMTEAGSGTSGWTGTAADAYRGHAAEAADALAGAGTLADGISVGVMIMGEVVAFVREFIRDMVGELVGRLIAWALEVAASFGLATPAVVAQATAAISKVVNKVADVVRKLVKTIGNVSPRIRKIIDKLDEIIGKLSKLMRRADGSAPDAPTSAARHADDAPTVRGPDGTTSPSGTTGPSGTTSPDAPAGTRSPDTTSSPDASTTPNGTRAGDGSTSPGGTRSSSRPDNPRDTSAPVDGRRCTNDPIDVASGEMVLHQADVQLDGVLPLRLTRTHVSSYRAGRSFGRSWASTVDQRLELDAAGVVFVADEGMILVYPRPTGDEAVLPVEGARWPLRRTSGGYRITKPETGQTLHFTDAAPVAPLAAISDRNGNRIDVLRGADGVPAEVRHSGGYRIGFDSTGGRVTAMRLLGSGGAGDVLLLRYRYDEAGRLREMINSSGRALRFDYDTAGRIVRWEDRNGQWYSYTYDDLGRCVRNDGSGGFLAGAFEYRDRLTIFTDSLGHQTRFHLNESGQVIREVDPLGNTTTIEWDRHDRPLSRTDPLGHTTRYTYDDDGNLITLVRPDGGRATATYNELRQPVTITDPDGGVWRREYDGRGNVISETDPAGATTFYAYTPHGHLASITDPLGRTRRVTTDAAGLPTAVTNPGGVTTRYVRDVMGRVAEIVDPLGGVTRLGWTVEGRLISRSLPDGSTDRWRYDGEGNQVEHVDPTGQVTRTEYTSFDLPAVRVHPDGARYEFGYDTQLRLVSVTNPQGLVWRYAYDPAGRPVSETDFNGRTTTYSHDPAGRLLQRVNGAGERIRFVRDPLGQVTEQHTSDDAVTTFAHDPMGRLVRATNPHAEVIIRRDPLGRIVAESINGHTVSSTYDAAGRRTRVTTPSGAESRWEYDADDHPVALHTAGHTMRFGYDAAGREVRRGLGAGAVLTQGWDANHRLITQRITAPDLYGPPQAGRTRTVQQRAYRYRGDGYLVGIQDALAGARRFELDPAGRILGVYGAGWTERYAYDPAGNVTGAAWPLPAAVSEAAAQGEREYTGTLIRRAGATHYEHDGQGRTIRRWRRTLSGKTVTWRYRWSADDRLVEVTAPDGARWHYRYDPLGRRIAKERHAGPGDGVVERIDFRWDGMVLSEQTHSAGTTTTWTWEPGGFRPLTQTERVPLRDAPQEWVDHQFYALITDVVGTPVEMVDPDGDLAWHARTTVWGVGLGPAGDGPYCPLRFPGQYRDPETGDNYNVHRYYDAESSRYESTDPLGLAGSFNPHAYVVNALTWMDPLGLTPCRIRQLRFDLGHADMSIRDYDVVHVPEIIGPNGLPAYGRSPAYGDGTPFLGPNGRPLIEISDLGLASRDQAVSTIYHEIYHIRSRQVWGHPGTEAQAEEFGQRMLAQFNRRARALGL